VVYGGDTTGCINAVVESWNGTNWTEGNKFKYIKIDMALGGRCWC
jgi:hypothetical protein